MKIKIKQSVVFIAIIISLIVCMTALIGCTPFKNFEQGLSEDTRSFTKIADKRMYAEAKDYKGYIYKSGEQAFCFRFKSPEQIEQGKEYPLVVFLHGMGDWGSNNSSHMYHSLIDSVQKYAPEDCFVFMPQAIKNYDWSDVGILTDKGGMDKLYNECLDEILKRFPVNKSRVYLTGMSMGGHGTVWQACQHSQKYAAIMPVCGFYYYEDEICVKNLQNITNIPMWFFHSRNDKTVPFNNSTKLIDELKGMGADNIKSSWFDEPLHDITLLAYDNSEVWTWLFAKTK